MMDRTDRHFRFLMRHITRRTLLYSEMIPTSTILLGDRQRYLNFSNIEHPIALQLGGDNPAELAECARIGQEWGYDEINLNVGCPSSRVQEGRFGACLMATPEIVAEAVAAMKAAVTIPVTVKHRIGIDDMDTYQHMARFVDIVARAGADRFSVHARKAWLKGLSPKENRTKPPLRYHEVYRLKREFSHLSIEINGGIMDLEQTAHHLTHVDAVMIGRAAYDNPWLFIDADRHIFTDGSAERSPRSRHAVAEAMIPYAETQRARGVHLHHITRHMLNLFAGQRGARKWRRYLTENARYADADIIRQALALMPQHEV